MIALALAIFGAGSLIAGYSICQRSAKLDEDWEEVTLEQFVVGDYQNKSLFKVSQFRSGDQCYLITDSGSDGFNIAYIPLYIEGREEDLGELVRVVAGVRNIKNEKELWQKMDQREIFVQDWHQSPPEYAFELSSMYPKLDWEKVRWVTVDEDLPNSADAYSCFVIGGVMFLAFPVFAVLSINTYLRKYRASKSDFESLALANGLGNSSASEVGSNSKFGTLSSLTYVALVLGTALIPFNLAIVVAMRSTLIGGSTAMAILFVSFPMFLLCGIFCVTAHFFISPSLHITRKRREDLPAATLERLDREIAEYMALGFHFAGYAQTDFYEKKWNAFMLSADQTQLVEITDGKSNMLCSMIGVTSDGAMFLVSSTDVELQFDGTEKGVPLICDSVVSRTAGEIAALFEKIRFAVQKTDSEFLRICPSDIFHVMHYEAILSGWWYYQSSLRHKKPEPLPAIEDVAGIENGQATFVFNRSKIMENAFEDSLPYVAGVAAESVTGSKTDTPASPQIPIATAGGVELFSSRFFQSQ